MHANIMLSLLRLNIEWSKKYIATLNQLYNVGTTMLYFFCKIITI